MIHRSFNCFGRFGGYVRFGRFVSAVSFRLFRFMAFRVLVHACNWCVFIGIMPANILGVHNSVKASTASCQHTNAGYLINLVWINVNYH